MVETDPARRAPDHAESLAGALLRALLVVGGVLLLVWIASMLSLVLLFTFSAIVIAIALNEPVAWLERRRVPRIVGTLGVLAVIAMATLAIGVLVGSKVVEQAAVVAEGAPEYLAGLESRSDEVIGKYPELDRAFEPNNPDSSIHAALPQLGNVATRVGRFSLGVATIVVLLLTWLTVVAYLVVEPRSLLRAMLKVSPVGERRAVERTYIVFSRMVMGWLWANAFVGLVEGVLVASFLSWLNVPGAFVWALLASIAAFIPKIGAWIMAIPPFLITLAIDPGSAVWIIVFYVVMNEVMSDVVLPRIQSHGLNVHPSYLVVFVLGFASVFGLFGAVVATPFAGLVAAIWDEFVLSRRPPVDHVDQRVERLLQAAIDEPPRSVELP